MITLNLTLEDAQDVLALLDKAADEAEDMPETFRIQNLAGTVRTAIANNYPL